MTRTALFLTVFLIVAVFLLPATLSAHNVSKRDASFVQSTQGAAIAPFLYLGAKHMVTGYDHLAFLVGVIFFLYRLKDVVAYVSLFTLGHSITLLAGVEPLLEAPASRDLLSNWSMGSGGAEGAGGNP